MDKYYFNDVYVQNFSEPKQNHSFRDGEFWVKSFSDKSGFENEKNILEEVATCNGVVKVNQTGIVKIITEEGKETSFNAIRERYIGERDIRSYCKKHYEEEELIHLFVILAGTLSEMESANVMHNDIKPQNILMSDNGDPVLIDFNTAKRITEPVLSIHRKWTEGFCAPEKRSGVISIKSDIFSFGCVLNACMWQNPEGNTAYSRALRSVQKKCCMESPEQRYESFSEVMNALSDIEIKESEVESPGHSTKIKVAASFMEILRKYGMSLITASLYGCGIFFLCIALYMIIWGPQKPKGYTPNLKDDIQFVVNDIKDKQNRTNNE